MKKRILALFCALCLLWGLSAPIHATGEVCFTAINITVLPLTSDTMPVWYGGVLYVPHTVFDAGSTGVSLGISSAYNRDRSTVSVFSLNGMLVFDLKSNTCRNQHTGELLSHTAIMRNNRPYLPAEQVCGFFGLNPPSYFATSYGYVVRITGQDQRLSDSAFADAGSEVLRIRLRDYNQSLTPAPEESPGQQRPEVTPQPVEETQIPVCLAFRCDAGEAAAILDKLDQGGAAGLFFFPPEAIARQGALMRRILGTGHSVGILAQGGDSEQVRAILAQGSLALETVAHTRTYYALTGLGDNAALQQVGWLCWSGGVEVIPDGSKSAYNLAQQTARALPKNTSLARLLLDDSQYTVDAMRYLLGQLSDRQYTVTIPRETLL